MSRVVYFGLGKLKDMLDKGNVWYVRHYEEYFDSVDVLYLVGSIPNHQRKGGTRLLSLGSSSSILDYILSPLRLYRYSKQYKPDLYLSADQVFLWWTTVLVRIFLKARIVLIPVCIPEQLHKVHNKSMSGLPVFIEKLLINMSYKYAYRVVTSPAFGDFVRWLKSKPSVRNKLVITSTLVDALPPDDYFENSENVIKKSPQNGEFTIIYVGRLHREKLVDHLIRMMSAITDMGRYDISLKIVGDGPERSKLEALSKHLGVTSYVDFVGYVKNEELPRHLMSAGAFVSTLTGTSLREAALLGLPIVAYEKDWIVGLLEQEITAILVPPGDIEKMAKEIVRLCDSENLKKELSDNVRRLARQYWSKDNIKDSLQHIVESVQ